MSLIVNLKESGPLSLAQMTQNEEKPILVDFWAPWCDPCVRMSPILEQVAKALDGAAVVCKANIDDLDELAEQFEIKSIPFFLIYNSKGQIVKKFSGTLSKENLMNALINADKVSNTLTNESA